MRITAQSGLRGKLIDLDTGEEVKKVIWFNLQEGSIHAYCVDKFGNLIKADNGDFKVYWARGKFKFIPSPNTRLQTCSVSGASTIDCKCDSCRGRISKAVQKTVKINTPILSDRCQCGRLAEFSVSDEVSLAPVRSGNRYYVRAKCIGVFKYCSWCYKAPKLYDSKGELISTWEEAGGVRPN
jgi:hypothetical protein